MSKRQCKRCVHLIEIEKYDICICRKFYNNYLRKHDPYHEVPKYCNLFEKKQEGKK